MKTNRTSYSDLYYYKYDLYLLPLTQGRAPGDFIFNTYDRPWKKEQKFDVKVGISPTWLV